MSDEGFKSAQASTAVAGKGPIADAQTALILASVVDYAIIAMDLDGLVTFWSEGARCALGWTEAEMLGRPASTFFTMDDRRNGVPQAEMQSALKLGRGNDERWHLHKDGTSFWANGEMMPLRDQAGLVQGFGKVLRDRTEQRHVAEKERTDAEFLRSVLASSADCIKVLDLDGRLEFMSDGGQRVMDVDDFSAIKGCIWTDFWQGSLNADARAAVVAARSGGVGHFRGSAETMVGISKLWDVQVTPILGADGRPNKLLSISRDISELRQADEAVVRNEARWHSLFEKLQEGFILGELVRGSDGHVADWRYLDVNPAWGNLVGIEPRSAIGRTVRELFPGIEDSWIDEMAAVVKTGQPSTFTRQVGEIGRWYEGRAFALENGRFAVLFFEVTERKLADARRDALVTFNDRLRDLNDIPAMSFASASIIGETLGADRVGYGTVSADGDHVDIVGDWTAPGIASVAGQHRMRQYGSYIDDLRSGDTVAITDIELDPRTGAETVALQEIGIRALLNLPIIEHGRLVALLFINCAQPRTWRAPEISFARNIAERTRSAVERIRAEASRRHSEQQFRVFAQVMPNHVWAARPDGYLYWFNDQVYEYGGAEHGSMDGIESWGRIVHPDDLAAAGAAWAEALGSGSLYETQFRIRRHDGTYRWFLVRAEPVLDPDNRIIRWVGTNTDIDDQRRQATELARLNVTLEKEVEARTRELRASYARQRAMFDTTKQLMRVMGIDGTLLEANRAALEAIGAQRSDVVGQPFSTTPWFSRTLGMKEAVEGALAAVLAGQPARTEMALNLPDGTTRIYDFMMNPVRDEGGQVIEIMPEATDVTEVRKIEEALRQSQKMEAVGQLTGGLAHDFNNLLTGITGSLDLLSARIAQGRLKDIDRYTTAAQGAAKRAAALTHRLLAFSRRQTLDPKPTDVNRLVVGMEELVRRTIGPAIELETVASGGLWATLVDPSQLENALLNLCINARDAMPDGGKLTVETGNRWLDARAARERELPPGQYVSLCVSDTGTGMLPDVIAKAFDPFFTTKPIGQGTGLGLSMVYGFVRQSGGQVRIYSEPGDGTMVCLYLPRHVGAIDKVEAAPELADGPRARDGETVLVVDDEPTVRMLVTEVLEELGYAAIEAADGPSGLKVLQSNARVDLLVTDVGLPGGMNGRQVADAARMARPALKVLFITGYAENAVLNHGHLNPGMHIMTKPFTMEALASRIKELITTT